MSLLLAGERSCLAAAARLSSRGGGDPLSCLCLRVLSSSAGLARFGGCSPGTGESCLVLFRPSAAASPATAAAASSPEASSEEPLSLLLGTASLAGLRSCFACFASFFAFLCAFLAFLFSCTLTIYCFQAHATMLMVNIALW